MAKLTAWVVTALGLLLLLQAGGWLAILDDYYKWLFAAGVLIIGVGKLVRNYTKRR